MSLDRLADVHWADITFGLAYAVLAVVAIGTAWVALKGFQQQTAAHRQDFVHRVRVYREGSRVQAYIEFVAALAAARSAGRRWHAAIRDKLLSEFPDRNIVTDRQFFNPEFRDEVVKESRRLVAERDLFYDRLDHLWTARAKIQLVGSADVFDAATSILEHYDPRQRRIPAHVTERFANPRQSFELNPGYPLEGSSERREEFMRKAHAALALLADRLDEALAQFSGT